MGGRVVVLLGAAALALWYAMKNGLLGETPAPQPADPAGRRARARAAIQNTDRTITTDDGQSAEIPWEWLYFQAQLETGDFKLTNDKGEPSNYALTRSLFNRHRGTGRGEWTGQVRMTERGEDLRIYDSPEQSVRDIIQLYNDPLYDHARVAVVMRDRDAFYKAVAEGNGEKGFVGPAHAPKAVTYIAELKATARRGVIA